MFVVYIGRCHHGAMRQPALAVDADVQLYPEVVSRPRELPPQPLAEPYVKLTCGCCSVRLLSLQYTIFDSPFRTVQPATVRCTEESSLP